VKNDFVQSRLTVFRANTYFEINLSIKDCILSYFE